MTRWVSLLLAAQLGCAAVAVSSQVISPTLGDTLHASSTLEKTRVTAGETIPITISLASPAPRDLVFAWSENCYSANLNATIKKGSLSVKTEIATQITSPTIDCVVANLLVRPITQFDNGRFFDNTILKLADPQKFHIEALPHQSEILPSAATATLEPTVRQFFRTQLAPIDDLRSQLTATLDRSAIDSTDLRATLISTLQAADKRLIDDEKLYESQYDRDGQHKLVFFIDLDLRYKSLMIDLRSMDLHIKNSLAMAASPSYLPVQMQTRPPDSPRRYVHGEGTYPPNATASLDLIDWHVAAYSRVITTGGASFKLSIASRPDRAIVSGKKTGDPSYVVFGKQTNIPEITLDFAVWTFKFEKDGCRPYIRQFDPVKDTSTELEVEIRCSNR